MGHSDPSIRLRAHANISRRFHCQPEAGHPTMTLNDLLLGKGIDPHQALVLRHRPWEADLNKVLPWIAAERPDLFNAFQATQSERLERAMLGAGYLASFIRRDGGKALFIGLYAIGASKPVNFEQFWQIPAYGELKKFGMKGFEEGGARSSILWFDLSPTDFYAEWKGKLVVNWPPPERAWWRRAHSNDIRVVAILEESALTKDMPQWDELCLKWEELQVIPTAWKAKLSAWRGVYFIFDSSDGKGYVGSAYGSGNLLGRWTNYAALGHGGNSQLRKRDPNNFRFSILQRVSPDEDPQEVMRIENTWKERLHSRQPFGLNDN